MKPDKPTPDFPWFAHGIGQWCKNFKGKLQYFGPWADWQAALERYQARSIPVAQPSAKPSRPSNFPLYLHKSRQCAKKIRGKVPCFGKDRKVALATYLAERDYLRNGRTPPHPQGGLAVKELVDDFLTFKRDCAATGELARRSWDDYKATCDKIVEVFGKTQLVVNLR